jgi:hypothetical protein
MPFGAGQIVYEDDLDDLQPIMKTKNGSTPRVNTTTLADDPDLSAVTLDPGDYDVEIVHFWTTTGSGTLPKMKTRWAFTGSWSGGMRSCHGPGSGSTATDPGALAQVSMRGYDATTQDAVYGMGFHGAYAACIEKARVTITATGNLSLQWAQQTVSTTATLNMNAGSYIKATKVTS